MVRQMQQRQSTLLFEDETGVHEDGPVARTWGVRGQTPVVRVTGQRDRVSVLSAISPRGRLWFRCYRGTLNAPRFIGFLTALLHGESVDRDGVEVVLRGDTHSRPPAVPISVLVGALGPRLLRVAGALADGTVLWMANARAIDQHVIPHVTHDVPTGSSPRVVAGLPVAVHDARRDQHS